MADDPWATAAANQEIDEAQRKLRVKMSEISLRKQQRSAGSEDPNGWPTLPENAKPRMDGNEGWGSEARPPAIGGAGRGRPFKLREGEQTGGVGSFAALGTGGAGNSRTFGQFGGFAGATLQQALGDQANRSKPAPSSGSANFSFKTPVNNSGFGSDVSGGPGSSRNFSGGSFGNFGDSGQSAASGKNNWPDLKTENNFGAESTSEGWPDLDNPSEPQRDGRQNQNAASGHSSGGPATVGRLQEENWDDDEPEKAILDTEISFLNKILHDKLVNTKYDVEVERQHPSNPLFSVKSFEELRLSDELLKGVYEMGFSYPSKIQENALPTLLADPPQNMIAQSQSGTGKTAAFALTMLSRVDPNLQYPQCLCLSSSYELALQTGKVVESMGKYLTNVKVAYAVRGGLRIRPGQKVSEQIIIGTPGTVLDWIRKFRCFDPKLLTVFVLDEADLMISLQGHQDQSILIHKQLSPTCQHLLFSATYDEQVMEFAFKIINDPVIIRLRREEETLDYIKQYFVSCRTRDEKYRALCNIYGTLIIGQAVIFCRTRKEAGWLAGQMSRDGHTVGLLSGELDIEQRAAVIDRFKKGNEKVLISTNLSARGIDVEQVTIVINYDLPTTTDGQPDFETYLHRIGRTGRFGKAGIAINFVDSNWSKNILEQIESHFGKKILPLNTEDVDALEGIEKAD